MTQYLVQRKRPWCATVILSGGLLASGAAAVSPSRPDESRTAPPAPDEGSTPEPTLLSADPILAALVVEAMASNPAIASARGSADAAGTRPPQVSALPDPVASISLLNSGRPWPSSGSERLVEATVVQPFPFPGKLALAGKIAGLEARRQDAWVARVRLSVTAAVRRAYARLLVARENLRVVDEQRWNWIAIEEVTRARYKAGMGALLDLLRAQTEVTRVEQARFGEEARATSSQAELNRLLGRPMGTPVPETEGLAPIADRPVVLPELLKLLALGESVCPELLSANLAVDRSRAAIDLAKRSRLPDFVGTARYMQETHEASWWGGIFGVSIPLNDPRKQRQAVAEKKARLRSEEAAREDLQLRLRAATERAYGGMSVALRRADCYAHGILVQDQLAVEAAMVSYRTGSVPFVSVLEAHATQFADQRSLFELLADAVSKEASLYEFSPGDADAAPRAADSPFAPAMPASMWETPR
jgi:cobalt-zinc-cadmium efflux system outer membrane protein